jgi:hypothetical protein
LAENTQTPPLPPDVTDQQQGNSLEQLASQQAQGGQQNKFQQPPTGIQLIEQLFNQVAETLSKIAEVAQMEDPMMIEYVKKMGQVGAEAMKSVQQAKQKSQGQGSRAGLEPPRSGSEGQAQALAA